jgi:hypothetical protein
MDRTRDPLLPLLAFFALLASGACSSGSPAVAPLEDPAPDSGPLVWRTNSTSFELTLTGNGDGFLYSDNLSTPSACQGWKATWKYEAASRTLTRTACSYGTSIGGTVVLTAASEATVLAGLSRLVPASPGEGACGADGPAELLTVDDDAGAQRAYASAVYVGCPGSDAGAYLEVFEDFSALANLVNGYYAACETADGGMADVGATCTPSGDDAGH